MRYSIDVASYRSKARADQLRGQLANAAIEPRSESAAGGVPVRLSGFASRDAAQKTAAHAQPHHAARPTVVASK
jgi:cell division protein FtsN